jgi:DNA gyrase subunit A
MTRYLNVDPAPRRHDLGRARGYLRSPRWRDNTSAEGLTDERYADIADKEQFLLTVTENGFRQALVHLRISPYQSRRSGHHQHRHLERNGGVVASFPVKPGEQLMLVTDQAKVIRTTVGDIRIAGRNTQGVTIFKVDKNEKVVSVAKIDETEEVVLELDGGSAHDPIPDAIVGEDSASGEEA